MEIIRDIKITDREIGQVWLRSLIDLSKKPKPN